MFKIDIFICKFAFKRSNVSHMKMSILRYSEIATNRQPPHGEAILLRNSSEAN